MMRTLMLSAYVMAVEAFSAPMLGARTPAQQLSFSRAAAPAKMSLDVTALEQVSTTLAGVVAVDGGRRTRAGECARS